MKLSWKMTEEKIRADWSLWMKVSPPVAGVCFMCSMYRLAELWVRLSWWLKSCWFFYPHVFVFIKIPAEWTPVILKKKKPSLSVFLEIRSVLLILRELVVYSPLVVCFQYKSFWFPPCKKNVTGSKLLWKVGFKNLLLKGGQKDLYVKL